MINPFRSVQHHVTSSHLAFLTITVAIVLVSSRLSPAHTVTISVDAYTFPFTTHEGKPAAVLREAGVEVKEGDVIEVSSSASGGAIIILERAIPVSLSADGSSVLFLTTAKTVAQALEEAGIVLTPYDEVLKNGEPSHLGDSLLGGDLRPEGIGGYRSLRENTNEPISAYIPPRVTAPVSLEVKRAVPLYVNDNGLSVRVLTTKETLTEGLPASGVGIRQGDLIFPSLDSEVSAGMHVFVKRSKGLTIEVDQQTLQVRTLKSTLSEVLEDEGISLSGMDRVDPFLETPIKDGMNVKIVRVREEYVTSEETIGYTLEYWPDPELEIDQQRVMQYGKRGLRKRITRIVYEDDEEVERTKEREWVETEPQNTIIGYGTKIVTRQLDTPEGSLTYWRKMRVFATWYNASHGGKTPDNPYYGITRLGMLAEKGVVAVDPRVIPFYTQIYVPGYGLAVAGDTGGGIKGRWVDLCYPEGMDHPWSSRWVDIYLLTPVPPQNEICWMLPDYPWEG